MVKEKVVINNTGGIHLRPAGYIAEEAMKFSCSVYFIRDEKKVNGKSLLSILSLGIRDGYEVEVMCDGKDEQEALAVIVQMLRTGERPKKKSL